MPGACPSPGNEFKLTVEHRVCLKWGHLYHGATQMPTTLGSVLLKVTCQSPPEAGDCFDLTSALGRPVYLPRCLTMLGQAGSCWKQGTGPLIRAWNGWREATEPLCQRRGWALKLDTGAIPGLAVSDTMPIFLSQWHMYLENCTTQQLARSNEREECFASPSEDTVRPGGEAMEAGSHDS